MSARPDLIGHPGAASVAVIMPVFNGARVIRRAIESVMAQTHRDWHLVCIDDASDDDTVDIIETYTPRLPGRLTIRRSAVNGGPARARNLGLHAASATWVAMLDADDAWDPERLERLLRAAAQERVDAVCDNLMGFDDHRQEQTDALFVSLPPMLDVRTVVAAEYQGRYNLGYLKPLVRRTFLEKYAIHYDEALRTGEDLIFLLSCLANRGRIHCINEPCYIYTTPVGHGSGKLSRSTTTTPRDVDLAVGLREFLVRWDASLSPIDQEAVRRRIAYLGAIAPLAKFRHARLKHDWTTALRLFFGSRQVRRQVWTALRPKRHLRDVDLTR